MFQIYLPITPDYRILNINKSVLGTKRTIMIPIDEEEENLIDNIDKSVLIFHRGNRSFSVSMKDIYCYGEVDFNDSNTISKIEKFKFLNYLIDVGIRIYSRYDYNTHSCSSPIRNALWAETFNCATLAKMAHGYLGKPKRILLFNEFTKK